MIFFVVRSWRKRGVDGVRKDLISIAVAVLGGLLCLIGSFGSSYLLKGSFRFYSLDSNSVVKVETTRATSNTEDPRTHVITNELIIENLLLALSSCERSEIKTISFADALTVRLVQPGDTEESSLRFDVVRDVKNSQEFDVIVPR